MAKATVVLIGDEDRATVIAALYDVLRLARQDKTR
jgi:hypothetical protein